MKQKNQDTPIDPAHGSVQGIRILGLHQVKEKTSIGKTLLYSLIQAKKFPRPISLSDTGKKVGWVAAEVDEYLRTRIEARDGGLSDGK